MGQFVPTRSSLAQLRQGGFEGLEVFDADDGDALVDLAHEAGEGGIGTEFDEEIVALGDEVLHGLDPADGAGDLVREGGSDLFRRGDGAGFEVADDGDAGRLDLGVGEDHGELLLRGLHEA